MMVLRAVKDVSELTQEDKAEAIRIILDGLGKAELELAASYVSPLIWLVPDGNGGHRMKNGTVFYLDTGEAIFAVTAAHVVIEFFRDSRLPGVRAAIVVHEKMPLFVSLGDRIIDGSAEIDIATFRLLPKELEYVGKTPFRGNVGNWPPRVPDRDGPVQICGFPGNGRSSEGNMRTYGIGAMGGFATGSHETLISVQIEREEMVKVLGYGEIPKIFDLGGMSGGPLIAMMQAEVMRTWRPGGVVISGPNPGDNPDQESISGFEVVQARPIHFIKANGELDLERWQHANFR